MTNRNSWETYNVAKGVKGGKGRAELALNYNDAHEWIMNTDFLG